MHFFLEVSSRNLELINEGLFLLAGYHFVLFINLLGDSHWRDMAGYRLVGTIATILALNTAIIIVVSIKTFARKIRLWKMKKESKLRSHKKFIMQTC